MWGNEEVGGLYRATLASMQAETDQLRSEVESYKLGRANSGGGAIRNGLGSTRQHSAAVDYPIIPIFLAKTIPKQDTVLLNLDCSVPSPTPPPPVRLLSTASIVTGITSIVNLRQHGHMTSHMTWCTTVVRWL